MKKHLVLIGACDSIGVPYTRDNHDHQGFFEMAEHFLSEQYQVIPVNCFHMSTNNDNNYIRKLFSENLSVAQVKHSQNQMLKKCKYSGIYPFIEMPKHFLGHYEIQEQDQDLIIKNLVQQNKTIVLYSAFVNDLLKSKNLSLFKLLKPRAIEKHLKSVDIAPTLTTIEQNIQAIMALNPDTQIYLIGLFVPTKIPYIRKNLKSFVHSTNTTFRSLSQKYPNVHLVNNENLSTSHFNNIDFHPNKAGHTQIFQNFIKAFQENKH